MGPILGRQDQGGRHVGPMPFVVVLIISFIVIYHLHKLYNLVGYSVYYTFSLITTHNNGDGRNNILDSYQSYIIACLVEFIPLYMFRRMDANV